MQIVMTYEAGDDCTCSCTINRCFEHDSVESAKNEFIKLCRETDDKNKNYNKKLITAKDMLDKINIDQCFPYFFFHNIQYYYDQFIKDDGEYFPIFEELNQWFENNKGD